LEANCHNLSGSDLTFVGLRNICDSIPFLSEYRVVIVEDLLSSFNRRGNLRKSVGTNRSKIPASGNRMSTWDGLSQYISDLMPQTTMLVFVDSSLAKDNSLLEQLKGLVTVKELTPLIGEPLRRWIKTQVGKKGSSISADAVTLLSELMKGNLWALENELEKLSLYAGDRPIGEPDVLLLVAQAKDANIFAATDVLLEGKCSEAMHMFHLIRNEGFEMPYIITMIARQLRQVVLTRDMLNQGASESDIGNTLGISHKFVLRKTIAQARNQSLVGLKWLYSKLLDTDLAIKMGRLSQDVALDILIGDSNEAHSIH